MNAHTKASWSLLVCVLGGALGIGAFTYICAVNARIPWTTATIYGQRVICEGRANVEWRSITRWVDGRDRSELSGYFRQGHAMRLKLDISPAFAAKYVRVEKRDIVEVTSQERFESDILGGQSLCEMLTREEG